MEKQIKEAFKTIKADKNLKNITQNYVLKQLPTSVKETKIKPRYLPTIALASICLVFLLIGFQWLYFTQTALISVDINPSLELGINRFNRVISVTGINEDGKELVEQVNLINKNSTEAVQELLKTKEIEELEDDNQEVSFTVSGNSNQSDELLNEIKTCTHGNENTSCHQLTVDEAEEAKSLGLPFGKYKPYLKLKEYEPKITPKEVAGMTMKEIKNRINQHENLETVNQDNSINQESVNCNGDHQGEGHQHGKRKHHQE